MENEARKGRKPRTGCTSEQVASDLLGLFATWTQGHLRSHITQWARKWIHSLLRVERCPWDVSSPAGLAFALWRPSTAPWPEEACRAPGDYYHRLLVKASVQEGVMGRRGMRSAAPTWTYILGQKEGLKIQYIHQFWSIGWFFFKWIVQAFSRRPSCFIIFEDPSPVMRRSRVCLFVVVFFWVYIFFYIFFIFYIFF